MSTPDGRRELPGSDPLVVLVPGLGLDERAWAGVVDRLPVPPRVCILPGMGRRAPRGTDLSPRAQADRLGALLADEPHVVLVAHSAGCQVAVELAARRPGVHGLVLVGPTTDPRARGWGRLFVRWVRTVSREHLGETPVLVPQYLRTGLGSMARGMQALRHERSDVVLARSPSTRVVVVRGVHDHLSPHPWCAELAAAGRGSVVTVPGAAHMVPLTHPAAVALAAHDVLCPLGG